MPPKKVSIAVRHASPDALAAAPSFSITRAESFLPLGNTGRKVNGLARRGRRAKPTLVMASPLAEHRRRWVPALQEALTVCEVAERGALERVMANVKPDVLVVDLTLPGLRRVRGLRAMQRLSPSTRIVVLTDTPTDREGVSALKAGARGYCVRTLDPQQLGKAVTAVQKGEVWAPRRLVPGLVAELLSLIESRKKDGRQPGADARLDKLTARQRMIADLIGSGACNKEIANRLNITERTVKAHLTEAFRNVGVSDRLQLALLLRGHARSSAGLEDPPGVG